MKAASIYEIKNELNEAGEKKLKELILRLAKFKKENKELLTFLLYEASNIPVFVKSVKEEMDEQFEEINYLNHYYIKKSLRKILRGLTRYSRFMDDKQAEADLLIYFCKKIKSNKIPVLKGTVLGNIYHGQLNKVQKIILSLHEDLQYDYKKMLDEL
jgi:hypothetical protein